jgi:outer membrane biosynthesis protein TonB
MNRFLRLLGILSVGLMLSGCESKSSQAPGGPTEANQPPNVTMPTATQPEAPLPASKPEAKAEPSPDPFATAPAAPSLGIPELKPPEIAPPKIEKKAEPKPDAKK